MRMIITGLLISIALYATSVLFEWMDSIKRNIRKK